MRSVSVAYKDASNYLQAQVITCTAHSLEQAYSYLDIIDILGRSIAFYLVRSCSF